MHYLNEVNDVLTYVKWTCMQVMNTVSMQDQ